MMLARMRTLDECYNEIKTMDNNTAITKYYIRQLAINNKIPVVMVGRKRLINLDGLLEYLSAPHTAENTQSTASKIRKIY